MKRKATTKKQPMPKAIKIEVIGEDIKLYKIWAKGKQASDPFAILGSTQEFIDTYNECCKKWNIQPDMKEVYKIVNNNNQKEATNDSNFLKSGIF